MEIFEKEYLLYNDILPRLNQGRVDSNMKPVHVPTCFYSEDDPGVLVMENLKDKGFRLIKSKEDGLFDFTSFFMKIKRYLFRL